MSSTSPGYIKHHVAYIANQVIQEPEYFGLHHTTPRNTSVPLANVGSPEDLGMTLRI